MAYLLTDLYGRYMTGQDLQLSAPGLKSDNKSNVLPTALTSLVHIGYWQKLTLMLLKVEHWAEWGFFNEHDFTLKYRIHDSCALCFDMQPYWKFYQLIFEGKNGLRSFN